MLPILVSPQPPGKERTWRGSARRETALPWGGVRQTRRAGRDLMAGGVVGGDGAQEDSEERLQARGGYMAR